jgi:hypothetical protein
MAGAQRRLQAQWQLGDVLEDVRHEWRNPKKLIGNFNGWVASQPPYIEAIVATLGGGGQVRRRRKSCSWQKALCSVCLWCTAKQLAASAQLHEQGSRRLSLHAGRQGAFLGAVMGQMTKLDPNVTKQLMNQPGSNPGMVNGACSLALSIAPCVQPACLEVSK